MEYGGESEDTVQSLRERRRFVGLELHVVVRLSLVGWGSAEVIPDHSFPAGFDIMLLTMMCRNCCREPCKNHCRDVNRAQASSP